MTYFPDLGRSSYVAAGAHVRAVGWLHPDHPFTKGEVPAEFLDRLKEFQSRPSGRDLFCFPGSGGLHCCEFCGRVHGGGNVAIPSGELLYIFPSMLLHYVQAHGYRPPDEFIAALMASPFEDTEEFDLLTEPFWHLHRQAQDFATRQSGLEESV
jgi:hypothetical protein